MTAYGDLMYIDDIIELFIKFLNVHDALENYKAELLHCRDLELSYCLERFRYQYNGDNIELAKFFILNSIRFSGALKGCMYWMELDKLWRNEFSMYARLNKTTQLPFDSIW